MKTGGLAEHRFFGLEMMCQWQMAGSQWQMAGNNG
jgi:hypothetical protein